MQKTMLWSVMNYLTASERMLIAAKRGCILSVASLITQHGADPNSKDPNGMTALHLASRDGHLAICIYLIKQTAKLQLDDINKDGQTALFLATLMGVSCFRETLGQHDILKNRYDPIIALLANAGSKVSNKDIDNLKIRNNREGLEILLRAKNSQNCIQCCKSKSCNKYTV